MKKSFASLLYASCALSAIVATPSFAQAPTAGAAASGAPPAATTDSDEIVVTARRREENLQDVPVSITAFSQAMLEDQSISSLFDLNEAVPGLQVTGVGSNATFSIRGRGQFFGAASGSVETYFADVPLSVPFGVPAFPAPFFDLQSLQALKGPQGTLFGRNTTGGAVLFVPQAPTDEFEGYLRAQVGDYDARLLEGAVNIPLGESAALRLAGFRYHRKGYTETTGTAFNPGTGMNGPVTDPYGKILGRQDFDNQDVTEFRATLRVEPTSKLSNTTVVAYHADENRGSTQVTLVNPASFFGPLVLAFYTSTGGVPDFVTDGPRVAELDTDLSRPSRDSVALINTTTLELSPNLTLKNIFGYVHSEGWGALATDADGSPAPVVNIPRPLRSLENDQYTNEIQLQGNAFDERLEYIIGGLVDLTRQPDGLTDINITSNTQLTGGGGFSTQFRESTFTSYSLFASGSYRIADNLSISAGIRHTWDEIQERSCAYSPAVAQSSAAGCAAANAGNPGTVGGFQDAQEDFAGYTYNAGAEWRPSENTLVYGGYRHGYKRGGFNAVGSGLQVFAPETVDDYYVGLKHDFDLGGVSGHFNLEGFWDNYFDAQRASLTFVPGAGLLTVINNAPESRYRGFDVDVGADLTPWLEVSALYSLVDAEYTNFPDTSCSINGPDVGMPPGIFCFSLGPFGGPGFVPVSVVAAGNPGDRGSNPLGLVSRDKLSIAARLHTDLSDGGELALTSTFAYQSRFYSGDVGVRLSNAEAALFGPTNSEAAGVGYAPGYFTVDVRGEWNRVGGSNVDLAISGTNVTDETFIVAPGTIYQLGFDASAYGAPRMFTAEIKWNF